MQNAKIEIIEGTISKGERKGEKWEAVKLTVGEWTKVIFVGRDSLIKTQFEFKYLKSILQDNNVPVNKG